MIKTYKKNRTSALLSLLLILSLIAVSVSGYIIETHKIQNECLRLHVIASSDSEKDQSVKLKVRDALLDSGKEIFSGETDAASAFKKIEPLIPELEACADRVLFENGCNYKSHISVVNEYFDTRQYEDITLPAGKYTAFKVVLGEGKGQNWWCVMFPPLCLPAVTEDKDESLYSVFGSGGVKILKGRREYRVKFKIAEIIEELINR